MKYGEVYECADEKVMLVMPTPGRGEGMWKVVYLGPYPARIPLSELTTHRLMEYERGLRGKWERLDDPE